jgi:hypothetical protein
MLVAISGTMYLLSVVVGGAVTFGQNHINPTYTLPPILQFIILSSIHR